MNGNATSERPPGGLGNERGGGRNRTIGGGLRFQCGLTLICLNELEKAGQAGKTWLLNGSSQPYFWMPHLHSTGCSIGCSRLNILAGVAEAGGAGAGGAEAGGAGAGGAEAGGAEAGLRSTAAMISLTFSYCGLARGGAPYWDVTGVRCLYCGLVGGAGAGAGGYVTGTGAGAGVTGVGR